MPFAPIRAQLATMAQAGYRVAPPVPQHDLVALEQQLGVALPDPYRTFVATVAGELGDGAELMSPARAARHLIDPAAAFPAWSPASGIDIRRFEHDRAAMVDAIARTVPHLRAPDGDTVLGAAAFVDDGASRAGWLDGNPWSQGALQLVDQGCGWGVFLVVDGPLRGSIWHAGEPGWLPHVRLVDGAPVEHDFASWIASHLATI